MKVTNNLIPLQSIVASDPANPSHHIGGVHQNHPPLISAVLKGNIDKVQKLLNEKTDVDCTSNNGGASGHMFGNYTPIVIAAIKGNKEIVKMLLDAGADYSKGIYYSKDARTWAQLLGHKEIEELLGNEHKKRNLTHVESLAAFALVEIALRSFDLYASSNWENYVPKFSTICETKPLALKTLAVISGLLLGKVAWDEPPQEHLMLGSKLALKYLTARVIIVATRLDRVFG